MSQAGVLAGPRSVFALRSLCCFRSCPRTRNIVVMRPQGFPARLRLKQRREFLRVQRGGRKVHLRHFLVFVSARSQQQAAAEAAAGVDLLPTRCGITVTRKVGDAVRRNRIKRLVREVFRRNRTQLPAGLDVVWVAKQQAAGVDYRAVEADFEGLRRELARPARSGQSRSSPGRGNRDNKGKAAPSKAAPSKAAPSKAAPSKGSER